MVPKISALPWLLKAHLNPQKHHLKVQFVLQSFSNLVLLKLDEENYLPSKERAETTIEGHDLLNHLTGESIPMKFATQEDHENEVVSSKYQNWKKQDALLKSWLLFSITKPFTTCIVSCEFSLIKSRKGQKLSSSLKLLQK